MGRAAKYRSVILLVLTFSVTGADALGANSTTKPSISEVNKADEYRDNLKNEVTTSISKSPSGGRLTVQYAVLAICQAAGVPYQFEKSHGLVGSKARRFIKPVRVSNRVAEEAIQDILSPVRLTFEIDEYGLYLTLKSATKALGERGLSKRTSKTEQMLSQARKNIIDRIGKGFVTLKQPPKGLLPKTNLSKEEQLENFDILWEAIDRTYSFFEHKTIDWQEVKSRYRPRVEKVRTTGEFYRLLYELVRELKDCHSWLCNYKNVPQLGRFSPPVSTRLIERKAVVTEVIKGSEAYEKGLRVGSIITEVDGLKVADKVEQLRTLLRMSSSERNFQEDAYRSLLRGEQARNVTLTFVSKDKADTRTVELKRVASIWRKPRGPNFTLDKGKFIWSGIHPSGYGYIRILSFDGRMEIANAFDNTVTKLRETPGLIIDVRENKGGFGTAQRRIVSRFITERTKCAISYKKNGPKHSDFTKRETYFTPTADWQYTKPIALLVNAMTGSAADLFVCYMTSTGRPITIGTTTHGNLTGVGAYVVLPCNLVVRVSNGYVCDATGRIIEGNGNVPQVHTEPTIADIVNGRDSVLERAVQSLQQAN